MSSKTASSEAVQLQRKKLQESLHRLLTRITATMDRIKSWPEATDDPSLHVETTSKLITNIRAILEGIDQVEQCVVKNSELRELLQTCLVPLDLLDLLDSSSLNPDCFSRGLLREALGQLAGLKRRKLTLGMLGNAVQAGLQKKQRLQQQEETDRVSGSNKRARDEDETDGSGEKPAKRRAIEGDSAS